MGVYKTPTKTAVGTAVVTQTQSPPAAGVALAVEAITASATEVYAVVIDNTLNSVDCYLKGFNTTGAVGEGTDDPNLILKADATTKVQYSFDTGVTLSAGLKAMVTTTPELAGVTAPSGDVTIYYLVTAS